MVGVRGILSHACTHKHSGVRTPVVRVRSVASLLGRELPIAWWGVRAFFSEWSFSWSEGSRRTRSRCRFECTYNTTTALLLPEKIGERERNHRPASVLSGGRFQAGKPRQLSGIHTVPTAGRERGISLEVCSCVCMHGYANTRPHLLHCTVRSFHRDRGCEFVVRPNIGRDESHQGESPEASSPFHLELTAYTAEKGQECGAYLSLLAALISFGGRKDERTSTAGQHQLQGRESADGAIGILPISSSPVVETNVCVCVTEEPSRVSLWREKPHGARTFCRRVRVEKCPLSLYRGQL